jgi:hypothetical protein
MKSAFIVMSIEVGGKNWQRESAGKKSSYIILQKIGQVYE